MQQEDRPSPDEIAAMVARLKCIIEDQEKGAARIEEIRRTTMERIADSRKILDTLDAICAAGHRTQ